MANEPGFLDYCPRCNSVAEQRLSSKWKRVFVYLYGRESVSGSLSYMKS